jgi:hypothetical protein
MRGEILLGGQLRVTKRVSSAAALFVAAIIFIRVPAWAATQGTSAQKLISVIAADPTQPAQSSPAHPVGAAARPATSSTAPADPQARRHAIRALENAPLSFIDNRGQADARAAFYARRDGATFWLKRQGVVFDLLRQARPAAAGVRKVSASDGSLTKARGGPLEREVVSESFLGANPAAKLVPQMELPTSYGYIHGSDSSRWLTGSRATR